jgi:lysophospholipase L1-like esterase
MMELIMKQIVKLSFGCLVLCWLLVHGVSAQDPNRFSGEIEKLVGKEYNFDQGKKLLLFTGSSSIRMWIDIQEYFPGYNVVNNGFGGSHFSDLIYFYNKLIIPHKPDILFIYEGDNDVATGKKPGIIAKEAKFLLSKIARDLPQTKVVFISPKPSIARWDKRKEYEKVNRRLERLARRTSKLEFADVWSAMLDENGNVLQDVFLDDNLHMNTKGYDIWAKVLSGFLNE